MAFTSSRLEETREEIFQILQHSSSSVHIKNLQSLNLQYAITAVGIFSMFEADLQRELEAEHGFREVRKLLKSAGNLDLLERFEVFYLAINVLKHGTGHSFDKLREMKDKLPFRIKQPDDEFFDEGDCTEIDTLVLADQKFVKDCANVVHEISEVVFRTLHQS